MKLIFEDNMSPEVITVWKELVSLYEYDLTRFPNKYELGELKGWGAWIAVDRESSDEDMFEMFSQLTNFSHVDHPENSKNLDTYVFKYKKNYLVLFETKHRVTYQLKEIGKDIVSQMFEEAVTRGK